MAKKHLDIIECESTGEVKWYNSLHKTVVVYRGKA
jgi:ribosomal protein L32